MYRRKQIEFVPEYYSGLNWKDAEHLVGKIIECSDFPGQGWKVGKLQKLNKIGENFLVNTKKHYAFYTSEQYQNIQLSTSVALNCRSLKLLPRH